jgi:hypothetical protein
VAPIAWAAIQVNFETRTRDEADLAQLPRYHSDVRPPDAVRIYAAKAVPSICIFVNLAVGGGMNTHLEICYPLFWRHLANCLLSIAPTPEGFPRVSASVWSVIPCDECRKLTQQYESALRRWAQYAFSETGELLGRARQAFQLKREQALLDRNAAGNRMNTNRAGCTQWKGTCRPQGGQFEANGIASEWLSAISGYHTRAWLS